LKKRVASPMISKKDEEVRDDDRGRMS